MSTGNQKKVKKSVNGSKVGTSFLRWEEFIEVLSLEWTRWNSTGFCQRLCLSLLWPWPF